jgi:cytochrome c6
LIPWRPLVSLLVALLLALGLVLPPAALGMAGAEADGREGSVIKLSALETGGSLFHAHCAGCHLQGGNIIRRGRTLKLSALKRNGVASAEAIAAIAAAGVGQMGGYAQALGEGGPEAVASWVWRQALDGWPRA